MVVHMSGMWYVVCVVNVSAGYVWLFMILVAIPICTCRQLLMCMGMDIYVRLDQSTIAEVST